MPSYFFMPMLARMVAQTRVSAASAWLKRKKSSLVAQAYLDYVRREKAAIYRENLSWIEEVG